MKGLNTDQFVAQAGYRGASITQQLGFASADDRAGHSFQHAGYRTGRHSNEGNCQRSAACRARGRRVSRVSAARRLRHTDHLGYAVEMANRPQTLYGLLDSPIGLAAWILDDDKDSYEIIAPAFFGNPGGLSRDDVLDNITMYWLTKTGISSARLYWENKLGFFNVVGVTIPVGVSAFPHEIYQAPKRSGKAYPKLVYYKKHDVGGHFAAWEQPQLFSEDVRATFRSVRPS